MSQDEFGQFLHQKYLLIGDKYSFIVVRSVIWNCSELVSVPVIDCNALAVVTNLLKVEFIFPKCTFNPKYFITIKSTKGITVW